jgi:hypothetical protein
VTIAEVVEALRSKLTVASGRHLYAILGPYATLDELVERLGRAKLPDGRRFPAALSVNRGILDAIPDDEFKRLTRDEVIYPEPTAAHIRQAFEAFLRSQLQGRGLVILRDLELLFAYGIELNMLRVLAANDDHILLLLPGRRERGQILLFPESDQGPCTLPATLIAENHLWELRG